MSRKFCSVGEDGVSLKVMDDEETWSAYEHCTVYVIEVEKVGPEPKETGHVYTCLDGLLNLYARPNIEFQWPDGEVTWQIASSDPPGLTATLTPHHYKDAWAYLSDFSGAGHYVIEAKWGLYDPGDNTITVTVVKVERVVKEGTTDEGPLYICLYDTVSLEAEPDPADAPFPEDEPHWTIESQPTGANASLSLSSGSATVFLYDLTKIGDYVVKARCGTSDPGDVITVTVYRVVTETVSPVPANRDRTLLGIGEQVNCWTEPSVSVEWEVDLDWGYAYPRTGTSTTFIALKTPLYPRIFVTPTAGGCTYILNFTVIAPNGENNVLWRDGTPGISGPPNNRIGSSHTFKATILPTTVSFRWAELQENIPTNTWTWPDGTEQSWDPDTHLITVEYDNTWYDECLACCFPIERIFDGSSYVDFMIPLSIPQEYNDDWYGWRPFLPGERHDVEFEGATQKSRHVIRATNVEPGNWMGPWQ